MEERDLVIVQEDEVKASFIDVFQVKGRDAGKTCERVRWIDTRKLEVRQPGREPGSWRQIRVTPEVDRIAGRLVDCLAEKVSSPDWRRPEHRALLRQNISQVFRTFFRALPVEEILRIAIREALRRLPYEGGPKGIPVFEGDAEDAYGGALGPDPSPIVSEADLMHLGLGTSEAETPAQVLSAESKLRPTFPTEVTC
jgi:hypothetical protein